jgi:hypothetical protein
MYDVLILQSFSTQLAEQITIKVLVTNRKLIIFKLVSRCIVCNSTKTSNNQRKSQSMKLSTKLQNPEQTADVIREKLKNLK